MSEVAVINTIGIQLAHSFAPELFDVLKTVGSEVLVATGMSDSEKALLGKSLLRVDSTFIHLEKNYYNPEELQEAKDYRIFIGESDDYNTLSVPCEVYLAQSSTEGIGVFSKESIRNRQFIGQYIGVVMKKVAASKTSRYVFGLDDGEWVVDSESAGNFTRFLNHSCEPNCIVEKLQHDGLPILVIFAKCLIAADDELTISYDEEKFHALGFKCSCGAGNCLSKSTRPYSSPSPSSPSSSLRSSPADSLFDEDDGTCYNEYGIPPSASSSPSSASTSVSILGKQPVATITQDKQVVLFDVIFKAGIYCFWTSMSESGKMMDYLRHATIIGNESFGNSIVDESTIRIIQAGNFM